MFFGYDEEVIVKALGKLLGGGPRIGFPIYGKIFQENGKTMYEAEIPEHSTIKWNLGERHLEKLKNNKKFLY